MKKKLMILPAQNYESIRLISVPHDFEEREAFRHVIGIISSVEETNSGYQWDDILTELEDHGFENIGFTLGPALD